MADACLPSFKATKSVLDSETTQYKYKLIAKLLIIYANLQLLRQSLSMIVLKVHMTTNVQ